MRRKKTREPFLEGGLETINMIPPFSVFFPHFTAILVRINNVFKAQNDSKYSQIVLTRFVAEKFFLLEFVLQTFFFDKNIKSLCSANGNSLLNVPSPPPL